MNEPREFLGRLYRSKENTESEHEERRESQTNECT